MVSNSYKQHSLFFFFVHADVSIYAFLLPTSGWLVSLLDPHRHVYFYNYHGSLNRVCICSETVRLLHYIKSLEILFGLELAPFI